MIETRDEKATPNRNYCAAGSSSVGCHANMGVVMERWCPTQQMLSVFLKET